MDTRRKSFRQSLDNLIAKYGEHHPQLLEDLLKTRAELDRLSPGDYASYSALALHVADIAKWIYDHLP